MLRLFGSKNRPENSDKSQESASSVADLSELEGVFDKLSEGLAEVSSVQALVVGLRQALTQALVQQRALKSFNARLESRIGSLEDELATVRSAQSEALKRIAGYEAEVPGLRQGLAMRDEANTDLQNRLIISQTDLRSATERAQDLELRLQSIEREYSAANEDLARSREMLADEQDRHDTLRKSFAETNAELETALKTTRSLTELTARHAAEISDRERVITELSGERSRLQASADGLSSRLAETLVELEKVRKDLDEAIRDQAEAQRVSEAKLAAVNSRAATLNGLLEQTREQLTKRTAELREAHAEVKDAIIAKNRAEARTEAATRALTEAIDVQRKTEEARRVLFDRTEILSKAISAKDKSVQRMETELAEVEMKLKAAEQIIDKNARVHAKRESELLMQLERERMERGMVEGAAEVLRRDKLRIQKDFLDLKSRLTAATLTGEIEQQAEELAAGQAAQQT
jgi:chromosome segregation ATPase